MKEDYKRMLSEVKKMPKQNNNREAITAQEYAKILGCSDRWARQKINQLGWVRKGTKKVVNVAGYYSYVATYGPK